MKDEFKDTKGPWAFKKEKGGQEWFVFRKGSLKKMHGCTIRTPVAEKINDKHDAELIASAPELLEALRQLRDYVEDVCAVSSDDCHEDHPLNLASKAINKALGKKQ